MFQHTDLDVRDRASWFGRLLDGLSGVGSVLICAIMALVCADILARSLFNSPIAGISDIVGIIIVTVVFLQLGSALRHQRMLRTDMFIEGLVVSKPALGHLLQAIFDAAGCLVFLLIAAANVSPLTSALQDGEFFGVVGIFTAPIWPLYAVVVLGSALTGVQYCVHGLGHVVSLFGRGGDK